MIHAFTMNGLNIVLDVNSGAVHVLDKLSFDMLNHMNEPDFEEFMRFQQRIYKKDEILEAFDELRELSDQGLLFSEDSYQDIAKTVKEDAPLKALCLHVAHDCNLRCGYCFASTGDFHQGRSLMSAEVGKKAIDFVIAKSGNRHNIEIDFFGGEPLMNMPVVKEVVEYARSLEEKHNKKFRFTITTNGVLLNDEIQDYINKNMANVVLSIDGRKEVNDAVRKTVNGGGSYDVILPKFKKLADSRNQDNYYVRGTFTAKNLDFAKDVLHLADEGFEQISVEPVVTDEDSPYALHESDLPAIKAEYEKLAREILRLRGEGKWFNFFHFMVDLEQGPCVIKRLRGCGCGNEYMAITPEGDVYPCHQFVGMEEYKLGDLDHPDQIDKEKQKLFAGQNVYTKEECRDCWAKFYCSGGCHANNCKYSGGVDRPHALSCELERKRIECAIMIKVAEKLKEENA